MPDIIISADSTCDLGEELRARYGIRFFPYHITSGGKDYLDNVDIFPEDLYAEYYESGSLPKTAAINQGEYESYFRELTADGSEVVHLCLASSLSSAFGNATRAAEGIPGVHVIDSNNLSTATGLLTIQAARMAQAGETAERIVEKVIEMEPRAHASFVMDTFDFMAAGGRCPQILAWVGKMASIKPELTVDNRDGSMSAGKMHRGKMRRVGPKYVRETLESYSDVMLDDVFVTHSGAMDGDVVDRAVQTVRECLPDVKEIHITQASCTISSHCGPGAMGVLFLTES